MTTTEIYNTFLKGLDTDTNPINYSNDNYYTAHNFRILVDEDLSSLTLTNGKGLKLAIVAYGSESPLLKSTYKIVGACEIAEYFIVFVTAGRIYRIPLEDLTHSTVIDLLDDDYLLVSKSSFLFSSRIVSIPKYERGDIKKVYWADGVNPVRVINVESTPTELSAKTAAEFSLIRRCLLGTPEFEEIIGGGLKSGVYKYAYCLFDAYGGQTSYSNLSQDIPIVTEGIPDNVTDKQGWKFLGSESGKDTNKGIKLHITKDTVLSPDQDKFSNIRVVSLYYASQTSIPEVSIVYEGSNEDSVYVEDSGRFIIGTLSYEEFAAQNMYIIPKTIATKGNFLFLGNITESSYDVEYDARAYRFNSSGESYIWDSSDFSTAIPVPIDFDIDEEADCANKYNILDYDDYYGNTSTRVATEDCKYQSDGATLGGEGVNVAYEFITEPYQETTIAGDTSFYLLPETYKYIGYQRDEIYRFGIRLFTNEGESSFVKWIGDIRFPTIEENQFYTEALVGARINPIGIKFTVSNLPEGITGYQIVRAIRNSSDQTVVDAGYACTLLRRNSTSSTFYSGTTGMLGYNSSTNSSLIHGIVDYVCPDTNYNNTEVKNYDRSDIYRAVRSFKKFYADGTGNNAHLTLLFPNKGDTNIIRKLTIEDTYKYTGVRDYDHYVTLNAKFNNIRVYSKTLWGDYVKGIRGSRFMLKLKNNIPTQSGPEVAGYTLRRNHTRPYGGYTYGAISNTEYIPCSKIYNKNETVAEVFGGDTFITWARYLATGWYEYPEATDGETANKKLSETILALVESKINFTYTISPNILTYTEFNGSGSGIITSGYDYFAMWETSGAHMLRRAYDGDPSVYFEQDFNMYTYNPVFSALKYGSAYTAKPQFFNEEVEYPNRIYRSLKKIDGGLLDNWSIIEPFNFIDVDGVYGEITKLYTHNNTLLCFQPKGISVLPIEEREITTTTAGTEIGIGTGGIMNRFDYITNSSGTSFSESVVGSNNGVYYIDDKNKKIALLSNTVQFISDTRKIMSYISKKDFISCNAVYNPKYSEIWFNIDDETIIFNEYTNNFTSTLDTVFDFGTAANGNTYIISNFKNSLDRDSGNLFLLDAGKYGAYTSNTSYSTVREAGPGSDASTELVYIQPDSNTSTLKYVVNPANGTKNRFDSIDINNHASVEEEDYSSNVTFTSLVSKTLYQTHTESAFNTNAKRKFRTWRYNQLRGLNNDRLHDNILKIEFVYNPLIYTSIGTNIKFTVNGISTNFIPTFIR